MGLSLASIAAVILVAIVAPVPQVVEASAKPLWATNMTYNSHVFYAMGPIVADADAAYFMFHSTVAGPSIAAVSVADGSVRWNVALNIARSVFAPAVGRGVVVAADTVSSSVTALNATTGKVLWRTTVGSNGAQVHTAPSIIDNGVFVGVSGQYWGGSPARDAYIVRLDLSTGATVWASANNTGFNQPANTVTLIHAVGNVLYTFGKAHSHLWNYLTALDIATGASLWRTKVLTNYDEHETFIGDMRIVDGNVVMLVHKVHDYGVGLILSVTANNGTRVFKYDPSFSAFCGFHHAVLSVGSSGDLYFESARSDASGEVQQSLYRLQSPSGNQTRMVNTIATKMKCGDPEFQFPMPVQQAIASNTTLVYASSTFVYGMDVQSGKQLWSVPFHGGVGRGPFVAVPGKDIVVGAVSINGTDASIAAFCTRI